MPFIVSMPKLSPTMEEGTIAKWRKREGDFVTAGEILLEIMTDKATIEFAALDEGYLRKILKSEGKTVSINEPIALFTVEKNENIADFVLTPPKAEKKESLKEEKKEIEAAAPLRQEIPFTPFPPLKSYSLKEEEEIPISPLAKKLAKEKGVDVKTVKGSGPHGRITAKDLEFALPESLVSFGKEKAPTIAPGTYVEKEISPMRKIIGKRLQASKSQIPHFYVSQKINATSLVKMREELKLLRFDKITFNDMIIRASAIALRKHPQMNTGFNNVDQKIIEFKTIDISVAVNLEAGLITPIIRHADFKNLGTISVEMKTLIEKAHQNKLKAEEFQGGSFSISNLGMFGITEFIAVINPPQSAILAIGGIQDEPVIKKEKVVPGKTLTFTLSCDHRVIDGTDAALFLKTLKELLENPISLII